MLRFPRWLLTVVASLGILVLSGGAAGAVFIVVPNSLTAAEGNEASEFLTGDPRAASVRYQQVYGASQFSGAGVITEIAFRPDSVIGVPFSATLSNVQITLSTTSRAPDGLSATFADNLGTDQSVVFSGNLTLASADAPGPGGTRAFDIVITLSTPFAYDPSLGNLLLDFQRDGSSVAPLGVSFDAQDVVGDSVSRAFGSRTSATAQFGVDSVGVVTRFNINPTAAPAVPEPMSVVTLGAGLICLARICRRRRGAGM